MKILLFGKNGQVGWELGRSLLILGDVIAPEKREGDMSSPDLIRKLVREIKPDIIVNAAAYTAVDKAEADEELATRINGVSPGVLAEEAYNVGALLIHYSTDYVFNGEKDSAYTEIDKPAPINAYGRSKLVGEELIQSSGCDYLIFRTSWVYASRGNNFLLTILRLAREKEKVSIVGDQVGSPTTARLIAETTLLALWESVHERRKGCFNSGLYHLVPNGETSWYGFAVKIIEIYKKISAGDMIKVQEVTPILTVEYPTPAKRPINSRLSNSLLSNKYNLIFPDWDKGLELCVREIL